LKNILCFIYEGFVDFEISLACTEINLSEKYQVIYVAYDKLPIKSSAGITIYPGLTVAEIQSTSDIEGLIIPGGFVRILKPELKELIHKLNNEKKLLAAICAGPEFLAKAGILNGKKYTTSMQPKEYKEKNESDPFPRDTYVEARMVRDENIFTAKGNAFVDFALEVWDWYQLYEYENEKAECKVGFTPT